MNCNLGAKYLTRELAENTARMLLRSNPAARQATHCGACGYFHLVAQVAPAPAGRPEAVPLKSEPNITERKIA